MTPLVSMFTGNPGSKSRRPVVAFMPSIFKAEPKRVRAQKYRALLFFLLYGHDMCTAMRTDTWLSC